jgi:hypothetical protein
MIPKNWTAPRALDATDTIDLGEIPVLGKSQVGTAGQYE